MSDEKEKVLVPEVLKVSPIVEPVINIDKAVAAWENFQKLKESLLEDRDYVFYVKWKEEGKSYQKQKGFDKKQEAIDFAKKNKGEVTPRVRKSGWRKLATPFNLSDNILAKEPIRENGKTIGWRITVVMTAPNGRTSVGIGACTEKERYFAHVEHDTSATAHTRAKNRAISDMIAGGEVSAEEIQAMDYTEKSTKKKREEPPEEMTSEKWKELHPEEITKPHLAELKTLAKGVGYKNPALHIYKTEQDYEDGKHQFKEMRQLIAAIQKIRTERAMVPEEEAEFMAKHNIKGWDKLLLPPLRLRAIVKELEKYPLENRIEGDNEPEVS